MTIAEKLAKVNEVKGQIRDAVNQMGGDISSSMPFEGFPGAILGIPQNVTQDGGVPPGTIVAWYGYAENIPAGWAICNGENGTPDLTGRFLLGASMTYPIGSSGGEAEVTLTVNEMPQHQHTYSRSSHGNGMPAQGGTVLAASYTFTSLDSGSEGSGQPHNNMPPYFAMLYLMKLPNEESAS